MENIFQPSTFIAVSNRIKFLSNANQRRWGKMSLQQMLAHCTVQLKMAVGEIPSKPQGSFVMRTAIGKWIAFSTIPWPKGSDTPREMNMNLNSYPMSDVESEKKELLSYLNAVKHSTQLSAHPFFGPLSQKEWGTLIYKHIDHHLKQFSQ